MKQINRILWVTWTDQAKQHARKFDNSDGIQLKNIIFIRNTEIKGLLNSGGGGFGMLFNDEYLEKSQGKLS